MQWFCQEGEGFCMHVFSRACCKRRTGLDRTGLDWTGKTRTESVFYKSQTEFVKHGLDWTGPGKHGLSPCFTNRELRFVKRGLSPCFTNRGLQFVKGGLIS